MRGRVDEAVVVGGGGGVRWYGQGGLVQCVAWGRRGGVE